MLPTATPLIPHPPSHILALCPYIVSGLHLPQQLSTTQRLELLTLVMHILTRSVEKRSGQSQGTLRSSSPRVSVWTTVPYVFFVGPISIISLRDSIRLFILVQLFRYIFSSTPTSVFIIEPVQGHSHLSIHLIFPDKT